MKNNQQLLNIYAIKNFFLCIYKMNAWTWTKHGQKMI